MISTVYYSDVPSTEQRNYKYDFESCCVVQDHYDDERYKIMFHKTTPELQDQDQDRFFWSQTGLVLRPTVSDHITGHFAYEGERKFAVHLRPVLVAVYMMCFDSEHCI